MSLGVHDGVAAKLKKHYGMACLELNTCVAHTYALVGKHAGQYLDSKQISLAFERNTFILSFIEDGKMKTRPFVAKFENVIGRIYNYFNRSVKRQYKLKQWYNYLTMPELKFKRLFDIRWSSIRDCLKPIMNNVSPGKNYIALKNVFICLSVNYIRESSTTRLTREHIE